jgi:hypothetical protein
LKMANKGKLPIRHKGQRTSTVGGDFAFRDYTQPAPPPIQAAPFSPNPIPHNMRGPYKTGLSQGQDFEEGYPGLPFPYPIVIPAPQEDKASKEIEGLALRMILDKLDSLSVELKFLRAYVAKTGARLRALEGNPLPEEEMQMVDQDYQNALQQWQSLGKT